MSVFGYTSFLLSIWCQASLAQDNAKIFDGYLLQRFDTAVVHSDVKGLCDAQGGWAVEPKYKELNDALMDLLGGKDDYFIGLRYWEDENSWRWMNYDNATYTNWASNSEGSGSAGETCAKIDGNGKWFDVTCPINRGTARKYVCQSLMPSNNNCTRNAFIFERFDKEVDIYEAERACLNRGAWLVQARDEGTNDALIDLMSGGGDDYHLGLKYTDKWIWRDGNNASYNNWGTSPEEGNANNMETCSAIQNSGTWIDVKCNRLSNIICQSLRKPNATTAHHNYLLERFDEEVSFKNTVGRCVKRGTWLMEPRYKTLNDALRDLISCSSCGNNYFINLQYSDGEWRWSDGSVADFTDWSSGEGGNGPTQSCAAVNKNGWIDIKCEDEAVKQRSYVCQSGPNDTFSYKEFVLDRFDVPIDDNYAAQSRCMARNGHLVYSKESEINDFVKRDVIGNNGNNYHIGLSRIESSWKWYDEDEIGEFDDWNDSTSDGDCTSVNENNWKFYFCGKSNKYICQSGAYCENPTNTNPCKENEKCTSISVDPYYRCCAGGKFGANCDVEYCDYHKGTCKHGGTCNSDSNAPYFTCTCADNGYYGATCGDGYCEYVDHDNPCNNGGNCTSVPNTSPFYTCTCADNGYYGPTCKETYCDYYPNPCENEGVCNSMPGDEPHYNCSCTPEYENINCTYRAYYEYGPCRYHINYHTKERGSFAAVNETCSTINGALVMDKNQGVHDFLSDSIHESYPTDQTYFWIGGQNLSEWAWLDTSPIPLREQDGFSQWKSGEPDGSGTCLGMSNEEDGFVWSDENCNSIIGWICETPVSGEDPCKDNGPCVNGMCIRTGCQWRCQCKDGFFNPTCATDLITITSKSKVISIAGEMMSLEVEVLSYEPEATVEVYKDGNIIGCSEKIERNGTMEFSCSRINESSEGNYTFSAFPPSRNYNRNTTTEMTVHVRANIISNSDFIFSPETDGPSPSPSSVACESYGIPTPASQWYRNNKLVTSTSGGGVYQTSSSLDVHKAVSILIISEARQSEQGTYTCKATNTVGQEGQNEHVVITTTTDLEVYGNPEILSSTAKECTEEGEITVEWKPNNQTIGIPHKFTIEAQNGTDKGEISEPQSVFYNESKIMTFTSLMPYTEYKIRVVVCPTEQCISKLNDITLNMTGHGLPGNVTNVEVDGITDGACSVSWELPTDSPANQITNFQVQWRFELVVDTPEYDTVDNDISLNESVPASQRSHEIETKPNRVYKASVLAQTCAGFGVLIDASGECKAPPSEPEVIPLTNISNSFGRSSTRNIVISIASQVNGPISCTFVILSKGKRLKENKNVSLEDLQVFQDNAKNDKELDEGYISLSIKTEDVKGNTYDATLGDGSDNTCDVYDVGSSEVLRKKRRKRAASETFSGKNIALAIDGEEYWYATITATPCNETICLKQSDACSFTNGTSLAWIAGVVLGFLAFVAAVVAVWWYRRRRKPEKNESTAEFDLPPRSNPPIVPESIYENVMSKSSTKIALRDLEREYARLKADEGMLFRDQYQNLRATAKQNAPSSTYGSTEAAMAKNRYKNIIPYDTSRVKLQGQVYDYVNACYVKKGSEQRKFIAAQGPLPHTVNDFWSMVLQQKCKIIVMLTKCVEAGKIKCEQYWPDHQQRQVQFGSITVQNNQEQIRGGYIRRELKIYSQQYGEATVYQFHFLKWPDHGVPATTSGFFRLYRDTMSEYKKSRSNSPILVHCSAGVGRTGTFIGYDILLDDSRKEKCVDVYNRVLGMRKDRVDMVQSVDQYEMLHKLLLETHLFGDTDMDETRLVQRNKSVTTEEFKNLKHSDSLNFRKDGPSNGVVIIRQPEDTEWIQIDATYVEAYEQSTRLILAKAPTLSTVEYFWRAISDNDIDLVVMLHCLENNAVDAQNQVAQYWPRSKNNPLTLNNITIELLSESQSRGTTYRKLRMARKNKAPKDIRHYQYLDWKLHSSPQDPSGILDLVNSLRQEGSAASILVHCSDDLGRSGAFCAIFNLVERIQVERKIDVFRASKDIRDICHGVQLTQEQYKFCFEAAKAHLDSANTYENVGFQNDDPVYQNL